jgi:hypothetical protein
MGLALSVALPHVATAQAPSAAAAKLPPDPWPRDVSISNAAVLVYQPQVNKWADNQIDFRCALAIKPTGAKEETFGVVFATARTQVDKVARTVVFENLKITKSDFRRCRIMAQAMQRSCRSNSQRACGASRWTASNRPRAGRYQAADRRRQQRPAAGDRQLLAGDPRAHRRRARIEGSARPFTSAARDQYAGADLEGRVWR